MRDLYRRLGVRPTASLQEIQKAVQSCRDPHLKEDAKEVLLKEGRRKTYDKVHAALTDIGTLRAEFGLKHGENWRGPISQDFDKDRRTQTSARQAFENKINRQNAQPHPGSMEKSSNDSPSTKKSVLSTLIETIGYLALIVVIVGGAVYYAIATFDPASTTANKSDTTSQKSANEFLDEPAFNKPRLRFPATGTVQPYTGQAGQAPLQIRTSSGANYLVRLEDVSTGKDVMDVFVRGGTTVDVEVPLGTYQLKYASGQNWYGREHLFGPETAYNKADTPFRFYIEGQQISGYTVTLYRVSDGNLRTSKLPPSQF